MISPTWNNDCVWWGAHNDGSHGVRRLALWLSSMAYLHVAATSRAYLNVAPGVSLFVPPVSPNATALDIATMYQTRTSEIRLGLFIMMASYGFMSAFLP